MIREFIDNKLVIASNNDGKILELREILKVFDIDILSNRDFNISEPIWPTPELIPYPPLTTFGYTNELKLLFKLSLPMQFDPINKFSVVSKWLVCADVCIPQEGKVNFVLSKGSSNDFSIQNILISEVRSTIPKTLKQKISSKIESGILTLNLSDIGSDIKDAYFFPFEENVIDYSFNQKLEIH